MGDWAVGACCCDAAAWGGDLGCWREDCGGGGEGGVVFVGASGWLVVLDGLVTVLVGGLSAVFGLVDGLDL